MSDELPKLRPLDIRWVQWQGQQFLSLHDPLRLGKGDLLVPQAMAPLLGLCDGSRDLATLRIGFLLRTGMNLPPSQVESFVRTLHDALLLDNERFRHALAQVVECYRCKPFRAPALVGAGYPEEPTKLSAALDAYCRQGVTSDKKLPGPLVGLVSPHIDYTRGWRTYAETWQQAREAVAEAELVILLGTDHAGSLGGLTLTRQSYATPWGTLPTDIDLVNCLANILGEDRAFGEEAHHIGEHSIELACVWLHYAAAGEPKRLLPVLCGPHEALLQSGNSDLARVWQALALLAEVASQQRTLVVAAGDLSHVGPAFGDPMPIDLLGKARVRASDHQWLAAACSGESDLLKDYILQHGNPTRMCGAAPIHFMLNILQKARGEVVAYDQCPADEEFGSLVSVAGVLYTA